jgi:phage shock protein PspC (stress-responsive transcriptional regulator)
MVFKPGKEHFRYSHGMYGTKIYMCWNNMKKRCQNKKSKRYGMRGVTVSEDWEKFENFYSDMGDIPFIGAQIDRIDNSLGYSKENCRWTTRKMNTLNRSNYGKYLKGVSFEKRTSKFTSNIAIHGVCYGLGTYFTEIEAHKAFLVVFKEWYGFNATI